MEITRQKRKKLQLFGYIKVSAVVRNGTLKSLPHQRNRCGGPAYNIEVFTDEKERKCICFRIESNSKVLLENILPE